LTSTGQRIVERFLQLVLPQEPVERAIGFVGPLLVACQAPGIKAGRNGRKSFNRLLVEPGLFAAFAIEAVTADRGEYAMLSGLDRYEPLQRLKPGLHHVAPR